MGRKKLTIEYIELYIEKEGYKLKSREYRHSLKKLDLICDKGHLYKVTWSNFKQGCRCSICSNYNKREYALKHIRDEINKEGYSLISSEYKNSRFRLGLVCDKGHQYKVTWSDFQQGCRCPKCANKHRSDRQKLTYEFVKYKIEKTGYILISKEYKNSRTKLELRCTVGHNFKMAYGSFRNGQRCPKCAIDCRVGKLKLPLNFIKDKIEKEGYKLERKEYINNSYELDLICNKGHQYKTTWSCFRQGCRCTKCYSINRLGDGSPNWKNYSKEDIKDKNLYRDNVVQLSNQNFREYFYIINPLKLQRGDDYHLDHIYSVVDGFKANILPEIISSPVNLRVISANENQSKNDNSLFTKEQLYDLYYQFESEIRG